MNEKVPNIPIAHNPAVPVSKDRLARLVGIPVLGVAIELIQYGTFENCDYGELGTRLLISVLITWMIWESIRKIVGYFRRKFPAYDQVGKRIAYTAPVLLLFLTVQNLFTHHLLNQIFGISSGYPLVRFLYDMKISVVASSLVVFIYEAVFFFQQWKKSILEAETLKEASLKSNLEGLKSQLSPHFLFNNLNVLTSLIETDPTMAIDFVQELSQVYRYVLQANKQALIPLGDELGFIAAYSFLLDKRFGNKYRMDIRVDEEAKTKYLPPLTLQLLVENALKHNTLAEDEPLLIWVGNSKGSLTVANNLQEKAKGVAKNGLGLKNIQERYRLLANKAITIDKTETEFKVSVPLLDPLSL